MAAKEQVPESVSKFRNKNKNIISILSIDGGGVRGLIPAVILGFLEEQLQVCGGLHFYYYFF